MQEEPAPFATTELPGATSTPWLLGVVIACSVAGALDGGAAGADSDGAAGEASGAAAAADVAAVGAEAVVPDPQPARSSAPAAAMDTNSVVTVLGACMARFLPSLPRCDRRVRLNSWCPGHAGQASRGEA